MLVSFVGFIITIVNVRRTRKATEQAISRFQTITLIDDLFASLHLLTEVEPLCRERRWASADFHCGQARTRLAGLIERPDFSEEERRAVVNLISDLSLTRQEIRHVSSLKAKEQRLDSRVFERLNEAIVFLAPLRARHQAKATEI